MEKIFSLYLNAELIDVIYVKDIYEASQLADEYADSIVLLEDKETRRYVDITDKMNLRGVVYIYGIYDDLWCDMNCSFEIRGEYQKALLSFFIRMIWRLEEHLMEQ